MSQLVTFDVAQPTRGFFLANQGLIGNDSARIKEGIWGFFQPDISKIYMSVDEDTEC